MEPAELRRRAREESDELGPEPVNPAERELWREERRGAVVFLAGLADDDAACCVGRLSRLRGSVPTAR